MFRPNIKLSLHARRAKRDIFGAEFFSKPVPIQAGIVRLASLMEMSSVRADSTASRGAAEDMIAEAKILLPTSTRAKVGDVLEGYGVKIEVTGLHPRINTRGQLDHYELRGKIREDL